MKLTLFRPFEEDKFFAQLQDRIAALVQRKIGHTDSEPVVQDVMIRLRSDFSKLPSRDDFLPFVFEIVKSTIEEHSNRNQMYINWNEVVGEAKERMELESPEIARVLDAILSGDDLDKLCVKFDQPREKMVQLVDRCRAAILSIASNLEGVTLP